MTIISDGTGTGKQAKVDGLNRIHTLASTISESRAENLEGNAYNINTGEITLTSANKSAVLYFKNNELYDYVIEALVVGLGPSTGGTGKQPVIKVLKNPTTGTIVSDATDVDINSNRNYGSKKTLDAEVYKGAEGKTFTNGTDHLIVYQTVSGRAVVNIDEIIPKGASIGVEVIPMTSNSSMTCYVAIIGHLSVGDGTL